MFKRRPITEEAQLPAGVIGLSDIRVAHGEQFAHAVGYRAQIGQIASFQLVRTHGDARGPVWIDPDSIKDGTFAGAGDMRRRLLGELEISELGASPAVVPAAPESFPSTDNEILKSMLELQRETLQTLRESTAVMQRLEALWA